MVRRVSIAALLFALSAAAMVTLQAIVVTKGRTAQLAEINRFLADARKSGFVKGSLDRARVAGVKVAPEP